MLGVAENKELSRGIPEASFLRPPNGSTVGSMILLHFVRIKTI